MSNRFRRGVLEEELSKHTVVNSSTNTEFTEKYQRLLDRYNEEKNARIQLEKKMNNITIMNDYKNINELLFMDQLLSAITTALSDPRSKSKSCDQINFNEWVNETKKLNSSYK